jgi:aminopeptidase N
MPTATAKERAWEDAVVRDDIPNETQRQIAIAFQVPGQDELLLPYIDKFFEVAETVWESKGVHRSSMILQFLFPRAIATRAVLDRANGWLATSTANPAAIRYVKEGAADLERALAAQARDSRP